MAAGEGDPDFRALGARLSNRGRWDTAGRRDERGTALPVHLVLIRDMGMTLGEILDFEELAEDCAADGRFASFMAAPPITFRRALGSPINPLAVK